MAEFVQTMKNWKRMCKAMNVAHPNNACDICLLREWGCPAIYEDDGSVDYTVLAERIEEWAAEHPEPVYPTWWEWLASIGAVTRKVTPDAASTLIDTGLLDPIHADIAQKLEIEPKEG